jgi:hypothetical protein
LANHHTASRIIQFLTKYGNKEQRHVIMDEVRRSSVLNCQILECI